MAWTTPYHLRFGGGVKTLYPLYVNPVLTGAWRRVQVVGGAPSPYLLEGGPDHHPT